MNPTHSHSLLSLSFVPVVINILVLRLWLVVVLGGTLVLAAPCLRSAQARAVNHHLESEEGIELGLRAGVVDLDTEQYPFLKGYSSFQISEGFGGSAAAEAAEVFIRPFDGIDLATVPYELFDKLKLAKEAAEDAEIELFVTAINSAGEDSVTGHALNVGLLKNRVLFATAAVQVLEIEAAHNKALKLVDPYEQEDLAFARAYLAWTIEADRENDGEPSLGVT